VWSRRGGVSNEEETSHKACNEKKGPGQQVSTVAAFCEEGEIPYRTTGLEVNGGEGV